MEEKVLEQEKSMSALSIIQKKEAETQTEDVVIQDEDEDFDIQQS